ncbi:hypothetical protein DFP75_10168 [Marinomonas alcarazii]|uniref:Porin n=1 Tax=Marinomonas alcarazii TaxID=491949 RepID=A0A318VJU6_9GAMM|nr:hypothetical protein [Marinomonas alcarazii]PYF84049.1 hypothetical protein DFP75_10168 [Marinomonas alcarazii]
MKAIKLASVFAVSAVAAAVSTATFAAEPVFTGTAGLEYQSNAEGSGESDAAASRGEVNIIGDTGLVYFDLDMESGPDGFDLDEIYVKQGAVQFGDFDGTILDSVAYNAGVEEDNDNAKEDFGDDLGVRYMVNENLTVALEIEEGTNVGSLAAAYTTEFSGVTLGVSAGYKMSDDVDNQLLTVGVKAPLGMATLSSFVRVGSIDDADVMNTGIGIDLPVTEQLSFAAQYYTRGGEANATNSDDAGLVVGSDLVDQGRTEFTAYYTPGDVTFYASYLSYEADDSDYSVVGAKVSF